MAALVAAFAGTNVAHAAGVSTSPPRVTPNAWCPILSDAIPPCEGEDIAKPVSGDGGQWSPAPDAIDLRFFVCTTDTFDASACAPRSDWQTQTSITYPPGDAGAWAVVQARARYGEQLTAPETSVGRRLATLPTVSPGVQFRFTGVLPDGSVRAGMLIDVEPVGGLPDPLFGGTPTPTVTRYWQTYIDRKRLPQEGLGPSGLARYPYKGAFRVPIADTVDFSIVGTNPAGTAGVPITLLVRHRPRVRSAPEPPIVHAKIGTAIRFTRPADLQISAYPKPVVSYQWSRCRTRICRSLNGQVLSRYRPTRGDQGFQLRLQLLARNSEGTARITVLGTDTIRRR